MFPDQEAVFVLEASSRGEVGHLRIEGLWVVASAAECSLIVGLPIPPLRVLTRRRLMLGLWGYPGLTVLGRARVLKEG